MGAGYIGWLPLLAESSGGLITGLRGSAKPWRLAHIPPYPYLPVHRGTGFGVMGLRLLVLGRFSFAYGLHKNRPRPKQR
jgi:hypothetical protein